MTPADLCRIGETLWGRYWRAEMAAALGVATRTVERWAAGTRAIPDWLAWELAVLAERRKLEIGKVLHD